MNQISPENSHIHLRGCDVASSYNFPSPIKGSNIQKRDCILNYCYDCPGTNAPDLESSKQIDRLFPASTHKIRFHISQNISKC